MAIKSGRNGRVAEGLSAGPLEVVAKLFQHKPVVSVPKSILGRARRAGPFKVPASMTGSPDVERRLMAKRFKDHLRGISGANKLGADPDEYVPPARPSGASRGRFGTGMPTGSRLGRLGVRDEPSMISGRGRPILQDDDDD
jgi:hypothetical protein